MVRKGSRVQIPTSAPEGKVMYIKVCLTLIVVLLIIGVGILAFDSYALKTQGSKLQSSFNSKFNDLNSNISNINSELTKTNNSIDALNSTNSALAKKL
jgi:peptidoglycan hydrolase CwlO-like protein